MQVFFFPANRCLRGRQRTAAYGCFCAHDSSRLSSCKSKQGIITKKHVSRGKKRNNNDISPQQSFFDTMTTLRAPFLLFARYHV